MPYEVSGSATCIKETASAILVEAPEFLEPEWIPQSQVHEDSEVYTIGTDGSLIVSDWFAEKRGWL